MLSLENRDSASTGTFHEPHLELLEQGSHHDHVSVLILGLRRNIFVPPQIFALFLRGRGLHGVRHDPLGGGENQFL